MDKTVEDSCISYEPLFFLLQGPIFCRTFSTTSLLIRGRRTIRKMTKTNWTRSSSSARRKLPLRRRFREDHPSCHRPQVKITHFNISTSIQDRKLGDYKPLNPALEVATNSTNLLTRFSGETSQN